MNVSSQDSSVSSSEESRVKRESINDMLDNAVAHAVDSNGIDSVSSQLKIECKDEPDNNDEKPSETFPWVAEFTKLCQAEIGLTQIHSLENLMNEFIKHVSASALECHLKPNRAAKLKKAMTRTLLLFHMFYSEIKKPLEHSSYLEKMSDLMAMYLDMEITASSRSKESLFKIASKLTSSLYIFLDRSHDHILDSIFKTKYMNKNYWELCNLIFIRVLRESPGRALCDMTYVRYVLAFKMWKRLVKTADERREVMKKAADRLNPPPQFRESVRDGMFSGILPKIPKSKKDITLFLLQAKFCVKEKTKAFLKQFSATEKRVLLSSYMTNFDRQPYSHNDTDDSRLSSELDQEDSFGNSGNLWANSTGNSADLHYCIRTPNVREAKKDQKGKLKKIKCKGIATPVFKTTPQACDSVERLKKKRKLQDINEVAAIEQISKCGISNGNVTVVRPRMEIESIPQVQVSNVESCQSSPTIVVKEEPVSNPDVKVKDCITENEPKPQESQATSLEEEQQSQAAQTLINQTIERLKESGRRSIKNRNEVQKPQIYPEKCLHDRTQLQDFNVFVSQQEIRSNFLINGALPALPIPHPFEGLGESSLRCMCDQCKANQTALKTNHDNLTLFWKIRHDKHKGNDRPLSVCNSESNQDLEPSSSLPFKKRRALLEKDEEERPGQPSSGVRDVQHSYPGTPMISIAMLDPKGQCNMSECNAPFTGAIDYSVSSCTAGYETVPAPFVPSSGNPTCLDTGEISKNVFESSAQPSYIPFPQSYNPPAIKTKFKTPAQLKGSPVLPCSNIIDVTLTPSTSASSTKRKSPSHSKANDTSSQVKSKMKTKVDKNLRKRKY